jgi:hypothetical protein
MPNDTLTDKQERYCRAVVELGNSTDAYIAAYDTSADRSMVTRQATRLNALSKIQKRIAEIRRGAAIRNEVTEDSLCDELEQARLLAMQMRRPGDAIAATQAKMKLFGFGSENVRIRVDDVKDLTTHDLFRELRAAMKELGYTPGDNAVLIEGSTEDDEGEDGEQSLYRGEDVCSTVQ